MSSTIKVMKEWFYDVVIWWIFVDNFPNNRDLNKVIRAETK